MKDRMIKVVVIALITAAFSFTCVTGAVPDKKEEILLDGYIKALDKLEERELPDGRKYVLLEDVADSIGAAWEFDKEKQVVNVYRNNKMLFSLRVPDAKQKPTRMENLLQLRIVGEELRLMCEKEEIKNIMLEHMTERDKVERRALSRHKKERESADGHVIKEVTVGSEEHRSRFYGKKNIKDAEIAAFSNEIVAMDKAKPDFSNPVSFIEPELKVVYVPKTMGRILLCNAKDYTSEYTMKVVCLNEDRLNYPGKIVNGIAQFPTEVPWLSIEEIVRDRNSAVYDLKYSYIAYDGPLKVRENADYSFGMYLNKNNQLVHTSIVQLTAKKVLE